MRDPNVSPKQKLLLNTASNFMFHKFERCSYPNTTVGKFTFFLSTLCGQFRTKKGKYIFIFVVDRRVENNCSRG